MGVWLAVVVRAIVLLLVLCAGPAFAQDLAELAARAEAREDATYPFAVRYRAGDVVATYATRGAERTWRADAEVWMRFDRRWLHARHEPEAPYTEWRGTMDRSIHWSPVAPVPDQLGLEYDLRRCSTYLRHASARVLRVESLGAFRCTVVLVDWLDEHGPAILHPMALWLSAEHDAYPVQVIVYGRDPDPEGSNPERLELEEGAFAPRSRGRVEELTRVGGSWFPVRGTIEEDGDVTELVADRATLRLGRDVGEDDFSPPSFMWIQDQARGGWRWFTPLGSIPFSFLWILWYFANVAAMIWLIRFLARRRRDRRGSSRTR